MVRRDAGGGVSTHVGGVIAAFDRRRRVTCRWRGRRLPPRGRRLRWHRGGRTRPCADSRRSGVDHGGMVLPPPSPSHPTMTRTRRWSSASEPRPRPSPTTSARERRNFSTRPTSRRSRPRWRWFSRLTLTAIDPGGDPRRARARAARPADDRRSAPPAAGRSRFFRVPCRARSPRSSCCPASSGCRPRRPRFS